MSERTSLVKETLRSLKLPTLKELLGSIILCRLEDVGGTEIATTVIACSVPERSHILRLAINYPTYCGSPVDGLYIDPDAEAQDGVWPVEIIAGRYVYSGTIELL